MPAFFQWLTYLVPAKYAVDIVRGIVLRGSTATELWQPISLLSFYTGAIVGLAVLRFKKTAA
jgi:ABC-2 type transport system permease protein